MTPGRAVSRRRRLAAGIALLLLLCIGLVLGLGDRTEARGSTLTRGPNGWLAARRYLEARGARVDTLGAPLERFEGPGVLVTPSPGRRGSRPRPRRRSKAICGAAATSCSPIPACGGIPASW